MHMCEFIHCFMLVLCIHSYSYAHMKNAHVLFIVYVCMYACFLNCAPHVAIPICFDSSVRVCAYIIMYARVEFDFWHTYIQIYIHTSGPDTTSHYIHAHTCIHTYMYQALAMVQYKKSPLQISHTYSIHIYIHIHTCIRLLRWSNTRNHLYKFPIHTAYIYTYTCIHVSGSCVGPIQEITSTNFP